MTFLPDNTVIPASEGNYLKLVEGENRFRVLGSAIVGYELWIDGKPFREKTKNEFTSKQLASADTNKFTGLKRLPAYFWAFPVYNYQTEKVQIFQVTQKTILRGIDDYLKDSDYGNDPREYDLTIIKDESKDKVEYRVKAKPPKELDKGIVAMYEGMNINLDALYTGDDPFKGEEVNPDDIPENFNTNSKGSA